MKNNEIETASNEMNPIELALFLAGLKKDKHVCQNFVATEISNLLDCFSDDLDMFDEIIAIFENN